MVDAVHDRLEQQTAGQAALKKIYGSAHEHPTYDINQMATFKCVKTCFFLY